MSVELNLPDLPEVRVGLGPAPDAPRRPVVPFGVRLRDALSSYLPLLLMAFLALGTWWLVKNSPQAEAPRAAAPVRSDPDYVMNGFALQRFDAQGRLKLQVEGRQMRHYPDTDRIEVDGVQIRAVAEDGRVTLAMARKAIGNGDGSEMQLLGGAEVRSTDASGAPLEMKSEFLHAFFVTERVRSHLPVEVRRGESRFTAAGLSYDHPARLLELAGPMRGVFPPRAR